VVACRVHEVMVLKLVLRQYLRDTILFPARLLGFRVSEYWFDGLQSFRFIST
jgi:hypothetical protein